jgi:hypothetical protein
MHVGSPTFSKMSTVHARSPNLVKVFTMQDPSLTKVSSVLRRMQGPSLIKMSSMLRRMQGPSLIKMSSMLTQVQSPIMKLIMRSAIGCRQTPWFG